MGRQRERENIRQFVSSYLDGELPPEDAAWVGRQISEDPRYAEVYRAYRGIRMDMRALPVPEVPLSVSAAIRAYTATTPLRRPVITLRVRIARLTTAAVTVAAAIAAIFTHAFGMPVQFAHGPGTISRTPASVSVSNQPVVATLANTRLAYNESAELHFSSALDETSVKQAVHFAPTTTPNDWLSPMQLIYTPGTVTLSTAPMALRPNTDYRVTIPKGLRDLQGNEVQNTSFDFSVGAAPPPVVVNPPAASPTTAPAPTDTTVAAIIPTTAPASPQTATPEPASAPTATADDGADATVVMARPTVRPTAITARPATATLAPAPTALATTAPAAGATATSGATASPTAPMTGAASTTASGSASATAVAKPTTPATTAPMPTPEPVAATATAAPLPTATTAGVPVAPSFQSAYAQNANRLGGPTGVASSFSGTQLTFTNGVMVYVPGRAFYVIYAGGSWSTASNPGGSGAAVPNATGGYVPGGAYGAAWTNAKLSGKLGYATTTQESPYAGSSQSFDNGVILRVGSDVYVLFNNGTYQLFGA